MGDDTIFALATAPGRSGVAVVRVSGSEAIGALRRLGVSPPPPRHAGLRLVRKAVHGPAIDQALVLYFPAPHTYTGEDIIEIQTHGSPAVIRMLLAALSSCGGLRPAEAGEFTRRALLNGRLDLSQVEGLGDLLAAETEAQQRQAISIMGGSLARTADRWRDALTRARALAEGFLDFGEEDELGPELLASIPETLALLHGEMAGALEGSVAAERIREGYEVAIVGMPNAGKSTLLNALARREVALTSEVAGTTRDVIEVLLDLHGLPVVLLDMAGLREAQDSVEALGIARALDRADGADVRVFLVSHPEEIDRLNVRQRPGDLVVLNRADLRPDPAGAVSGRTGFGLDTLLGRLTATLSDRARGSSLLTRERHRRAVARAQQDLVIAGEALREHPPQAEVAASAMAMAMAALDGLVGRVDVEDVLDVVFREFCVGK